MNLVLETTIGLILHLYPCKHVTSLMKAPTCVLHITINLCHLNENVPLMAMFKAKHYISIIIGWS